MKSFDTDIVNDAVFKQLPVDEVTFLKAITPIPDNNLSDEMVQINDDIIEMAVKDQVQCWKKAMEALAQGNISYVVTRVIYVEYHKYAKVRNTYLTGIKATTNETDGSQVAANFETYLTARGYQKEKKNSKRKRKRD